MHDSNVEQKAQTITLNVSVIHSIQSVKPDCPPPNRGPLTWTFEMIGVLYPNRGVQFLTNEKMTD